MILSANVLSSLVIPRSVIKWLHQLDLLLLWIIKISCVQMLDVDLKIRSENEDSCVVLNVALRPLYIHQIGDK